ncbi:hypothetical protein S7711_10924 [Stachybotrys chartarum IBT 7711]|uniref:Uncharacterized protein n=1 Tax=Stachybotrys chartarum (strain CBS 109288 / IBT 7711) TaxID=1280523 RepID=A0A084B4L8_STACB|nr:hypothetical protein S7711_10924 [Stachybotrys chartarum IBT 7711]KFA48380.1 hypothetical protein S40293_10824 [Stachybotrys chartarum IBT 40293]
MKLYVSLESNLEMLQQQTPDNVLQLLEGVWHSHGPALIGTPAVRDAIQQLPVPCLSGGVYALCDTYLPLPSLRRQCARFMASHESFPFLDLNLGSSTTTGSEEEMLRDWGFLCAEFGVSRDNDVGFLLEVVSYIKDANPDGLSLGRCQNLARLYVEIETKCSASPDSANVRDVVRCFFRDINGIAIPALRGAAAHAQWVGSEACTWQPPAPTTKYPIKAIYEGVLGTELRADSTLALFFRRTLGL